MEANTNKNLGTGSCAMDRWREKNPTNNVVWKINNKMLARIKMCGTKCVEIVNDGIVNGRPDFNTEEELFEFLGLEYLAPHEREM